MTDKERLDASFERIMRKEIERLQAEVERLVAELLESNRIISHDAKQIFTLGEQVKHLQAEVERLKAELKNDADEFEHLHEYWNGHESSAVDVCFHLFERCEAAIERLRAVMEKGAK